jgi:hypothetical protein
LECRNSFQSFSDLFYTAECDLQLFNFAIQKNDFEQAYFYCEENLALRKEIGDVDGEGSALFTLAMTEFYQGNLPRAIDLAEKSLACFEIMGNSEASAFSLVTLCLISFGPEITSDQIASFSILELRDYVQNEIAKLIERP